MRAGAEAGWHCSHSSQCLSTSTGRLALHAHWWMNDDSSQQQDGSTLHIAIRNILSELSERVKIAHILFSAFLEMPFFLQMDIFFKNIKKMGSARLMVSNFKREILGSEWNTLKNKSLTLKFVGKDLPFPWAHGLFHSHVWRYPTPLQSYLGSRTAGNILSPLQAPCFAALSKHILRSSEVVKFSFQLPEP